MLIKEDVLNVVQNIINEPIKRDGGLSKEIRILKAIEEMEEYRDDVVTKVIKKSEKLNDEIKYYWIGHTEQFGLTRVCTDTLKNAIKYARRSQPNYRPFYIIKAVTHFEIIGIVNKHGKFQSRTF